VSDVPPLSDLLVEPVVRRALEEDLGQGGDITSRAVIPAGVRIRAEIVARSEGVVAGLHAAATTFSLVDAGLILDVATKDGSSVASGAVMAVVEGSARSILCAERTALNFLGHLSGVATATHALVSAVSGTSARICCTRKTTPGLRALEKHAVLMGGGVSHRYGLDGAILIKDNHIAVAGGVRSALEAARRVAGPVTSIEIEVDTLDQLVEALDAQVAVVLLDNMPPELLRQAVEMTDGRAVLEASGGVTPDTVHAIAQTGVDYISSGWITHSAPALDCGLDFSRESSSR
jgi:nicotinate-nucleotide pyrophosphorylase (carboxylating)